MGKLSFSKVALGASFAVTLLVTSVNVSMAANKFEEKILTNDIAALEDPYFQISAVTTKEISAEEAALLERSTPSHKIKLDTKAVKIPLKPMDNLEVGNGSEPKPKTGILDGIIMVADKLIAIGQKLMPIIDKGRAVVTNNPMGAVAVLPRLDRTEKEVHDMGNWSLPTTKHYKIVYLNGWGSEVVTFIYSVTYQYGGTFEGKGKYLTGIRASARQIQVSWGFDLDASSQLLQISNVGTSQNIVAAATLEISYTVKNWTKTVTNVVSYFVVGDGRMYKLDNL